MGRVIRMASQVERLSIVEVKVQHIDGKLDDLKGDVKEMHDCLDATRDGLNERLDKMLEEYRINRDKFYENAKALHEDEKKEHKELHTKITELQQFKQKWVYMFMGGVAVLGWVTGHLDKILGFLK
jgi:chromosome segregation ATPase